MKYGRKALPLPNVPYKTTTSDIPALTGVRFIAAVGVLLTHFSQTDSGKPFSWGVLDPLILHGAMGVDVFFVLSGFILTYVYRERFRNGNNGQTWLAFMQLRFARLYPVHIVTMLAMFAIYIAGRHTGIVTHHELASTPYSILANVTLTHAWFPRLVTATNGPAWSISAEWFAYLLFPFLCLGLSKSRLFWSAAVVIGTVFAAAMTPHLAPLVQISLEFSFGVAAYELASRTRFFTGSWAVWVSLVLVFISTYLLSLSDPVISRFTPGPHLRAGIMLAAGLGFASLSHSSSAISRFLSHRRMVYGGEISYSIYMCHWPIWIMVQKGLAHVRFFGSVPHVIFMLLAFALTLAVSIGCYHWIELPGRKALRRISLSKAQRQRDRLAMGQAA